MRTETALDEARRMKNHFKVFEHLEEVLAEVHAAKGVLSSTKGSTVDITKQIDRVKETLKKKEEELKQFLQAEVDKRRASTKDTLSIEVEHKQSLQEEKRDFQKKMAIRKKALDKQISEKEAKLSSLDDQLKVAQSSLGALQRSITKLQSQIQGLQPGV